MMLEIFSIIIKKYHFSRTNDEVIAKMNVLFDKAMYEKGRSLDTAGAANNNKVDDPIDKDEEGKSIEKAIKESLASGKVGSLSVDPNYLEFEPLASKYHTLYVTHKSSY